MVRGESRLRMLGVLAFLTTSILTAQASGPSNVSEDAPAFRDYLVGEVFKDVAAEPIFSSAQQRRFRTRIRDGVSKGSGVWNGSWKNPIKSSGPNFAGHYYVVRWGCGSDCLMLAIVDAQSGKVYDPPLSAKGEELYLPMDPLSDVEIDFRVDSSLMILRNACKEARRECGVYYFNWQNDHFILLRRILQGPTKAR